MTDYIELICVKEKSKLRVRIITPGYYNDANCQFPRDMRMENRKFRVPKEYVNLITQRGKYFYSVKKRDYIEIVKEEIDINNLKIYEDNSNNDCAICLVNTKSVVFYKCGHYYCCKDCASFITKCPICRESIVQYIEKELVL